LANQNVERLYVLASQVMDTNIYIPLLVVQNLYVLRVLA
jgi:hypothetical protein